MSLPLGQTPSKTSGLVPLDLSSSSVLWRGRLWHFAGAEDDPPAGDPPQTPPPAPVTPPPAGQEPPTTFDAAYVAELRREAAANRKKASDAEAKLKELDDAKLGETEKLAKRLAEAEQRAQEAQATLATQTIRLEVERQARKLNVVDEEAAFVLMDKAGLAESDDLAKSVEQRLKKLTADKPWLVQQASAGTTAVPGTPRANGQAPTRDQLVNDKYEKLKASGSYSRLG